MYHAYDYAWRRIVLEEQDASPPIDPSKSWFNPGLVDRAADMWAGGDEYGAWEVASRWFAKNQEYDSLVVRRGGTDFRFARTAARNVVLVKVMHASAPIPERQLDDA